MDKSGLIEETVRRAADGGTQVSAEQAGRVVDALFGTLEHAGAIAEALRRGESVTVLGFGTFHAEDSRAVLQPGKALNEYIGHDAPHARR
ncbi:HU family DNA-binding protein [Streptomyces sp. YIM 98790]|uniref:HU family DNA-binding protein n=1 Tax=Streptomyces sp. YIM 98790 TaxID=2689077 RepID=UPI00140931BB|nr:HU family DNA-binding protein [Streptomyces sp. YIM 98790]